MTLYAESTADQTDHFVRENVIRGYDAIMTFKSLQSTSA